MASDIPYYIGLAASTNPFGGNPAVVVLLDELPSDETLFGISTNFNQPMTIFLSNRQVEDDPKVVSFDARFIPPSGGPAGEPALCGHASMVAGQTLFNEDVVSKDVEVIRFKTRSGQIMEARNVGEGWTEIAVPAGTLEPLSEEHDAVCRKALDEAFGRSLDIKNIAKGVGVHHYYLHVELDVKENLGGSIVNPEPLSATGFIANVITTDSPKGEEFFVSRMFCPTINKTTGEDMVCGSAHGLLMPFWSTKKNEPQERLLKATQVSPRGGNLRVLWDKVQDVVRLQGQVYPFAKGVLNTLKA